MKAIDWGMLGALAGTDNWASIKAEKAKELQYVALQNSLIQQRIADQQRSAAEVQEYLNTMSKLSVLDPDKAKIQAKEEELRAPIREGLMKANGDLRKYMLTGGLQELNKYRENLLGSDEAKRGLANAYNYQQYMADLKAGLVGRKSTWLDKATGANKTAAFEDMLAAFNAGELDALNYRGGYKRPDLTGMREGFGKVYGKDPYAREAVNAQTHYDYAFREGKKEGLNDEDATDFATNATKEYINAVNSGGTPLYFGQKDPSARALNYARIAKLNSGDDGMTNAMDWLLALASNDKKRLPPNVAIREVPMGGRSINQEDYNLPQDLTEGLSELVGVKLDSKGEAVNKPAIIQTNKMYIGDEPLDISGIAPENIKSMQPTGKVVKVVDKDGNEKHMVQYAVTINETGLESAMFRGKKVGGMVSDQKLPFAKRKSTDWWPIGDDYEVTMEVNIPLSEAGPQGYRQQQFESYRRIMNRNSPSNVRGTGLSFEFSDALQGTIQEGDAIFNGQ